MNIIKKRALAICIASQFIFSTSLAANSDKNTEVNEIENKIENIKTSSAKDYDTESAVAALYQELLDLKNNVLKKNEELTVELNSEKEKTANYTKSKEAIKAYLEKIRQQDDEEKNNPTDINIRYNTPVQPTNNYLINPVPSARINNYIQDAANAQGYARMEFAYAPQQVYKIYCKIGYLTDLEFKKGEKITYVGGGDTAQWMIDKSTVNDTAHLYIKPIANNIATNIIVNTSGGHVYQIILNSGSWYNPMVSWNYGNEDNVQSALYNNKYKDDEIYPAGKGINISPENIYFSYKITAKKGNLPDWAPISIFDDGSKTYIKFDKMSDKLPVLFIKEKGEKKLSLANYRQSNHMFIVDKIFDEAQLQISSNDRDIITIKRK